MPHPGDDGGFGTAFNWDSLGSGHGAAADGRGMIRHGRCECVGKAGVPFMESQKRQDGPTKVFDVFLLRYFTPL